MRILFPWEPGHAEQQAAIAAAQTTGAPVVIPTAGWSGGDYSLEHRRETVDITEAQMIEQGWSPDQARTFAVDAAERYDRRN